MRPIVYMTLGFAPVIAAVIYIYFYHRISKNFSSLLIKSFFLGMAGILVLLAAQYISSLLGLNELRNLKRTIFYSFVTVGFASELGMYSIYRCLIIPKEAIDKPIHGITFSIMVALGFSTLRMLLFILDPLGIRSLFPETLYAFVFVPANLIFAVILGFYVGMAKFIKSRFVYNLTGLFAAAFFHGLFNFCLLTKDFKLLSLFAFGSMVIVFILGIKAAYTKPEPLDKI
ncbi:MAG: PrsW family intramembrane metalloprotease [Bacteroidales bacterium]|nr:PrsW family intramembrane metalloprotease [Bacteroidales bacterium]